VPTLCGASALVNSNGMALAISLLWGFQSGVSGANTALKIRISDLYYCFPFQRKIVSFLSKKAIWACQQINLSRREKYVVLFLRIFAPTKK
jgi:hypothetical protein